jgi:hypothetical protein
MNLTHNVQRHTIKWDGNGIYQHGEERKEGGGKGREGGEGGEGGRRGRRGREGREFTNTGMKLTEWNDHNNILEWQHTEQHTGMECN